MAGKNDIPRRQALVYMGALGSAALVGCGSAESSSLTDLSPASSDGSAAACDQIPDETSGPYPDTKNMIADSSYHRSDITEGKPGTPLVLTLTVVDVRSSCAPIVGALVEIWHCDAGGIYSEYVNTMNAGSTSTTFLRGVQATDDNGQVRFTTIYPGWYSPRVTHVHVQVYDGANLQKTTQFGFPDSINAGVYGQAALYSKGQNATINDTDQVFGNAARTGSDDGGGHEFQIAAVSGDNTAGYSANIQIGISGYV